MPDAEGDAKAPLPIPAARFGGQRDPEAASPLEGFMHDLDFTRFDSRLGRWVPLALAAAVAVAAAQLGVFTASSLAVAVGAGLALAVVVRERDRWRSQDVVGWFFLDRHERWQRDTGRPSPNGDPAAAEIWLGVHQPGSVPPIYRVIAAGWTGDEAAVARELARMPETTVDEVALKRWVIDAQRWAATGEADTAEIASLADRIEDPADRTMVRSWLAMVESARRWKARDRGWLGPLVAEWPRAVHRPLGLRRSARLWLSRFIVIPAFAISCLLLGSLGVAIADPARQVPPEYAGTAIYTRGDIPDFDPNRVWIVLPRIAGALPAASRADARQLDEEGIDAALAEGLPSLAWELDTVEVAGPADSAGHRVWSVEVLLGEPGSAGDRHAIITFDREYGPAWLYRIDGGVADAIRDAVGLGR